MVILAKVIYRFNTIFIKIPNGFFAQIDKLILKFICKFKGPLIAKTTLKKSKVGGFTCHNFLQSYSNQGSAVLA